MPKDQQEETLVPDVYLLIHAIAGGEESHNIIHYYPTEDAPFLDLQAAAKVCLGGLYEPDKGECLQLLMIDNEPDLELTADDGVGSRIFTDFHEGELTRG